MTPAQDEVQVLRATVPSLDMLLSPRCTLCHLTALAGALADLVRNRMGRESFVLSPRLISNAALKEVRYKAQFCAILTREPVFQLAQFSGVCA